MISIKKIIIAPIIVVYCLICFYGCSSKTIDLLNCSSTIRYATVCEMLQTSPTDYLGKSIKIQGEVRNDKQGAVVYHFVVINDSTNCCNAGLEFRLNSQSYPNSGSNIKVVGTFSKYTENKNTYYYLANCKILA